MYKQSILTAAYQQSYRKLVFTAEAEKAIKWIGCLDKGIKEIEANGSIQFDRKNRVLRFVSRFSGKRRIVTKDGCSKECDDQGKPSYHAGMFEILDRYYSMIEEPSEKPYYQRQINSNGKRDTSLPTTAIRI
jgi:hypothetical protein